MNIVRIIMRVTAVYMIAGLLIIIPAYAASGQAILNDRCSTCHNLTGPSPQTIKELQERKGPDLFYAGNKYKKEWLEEWLQAPKRIRPAGMYYGKHITPGVERDVLDTSTLEPHMAVTEEDADEIAEALMTYKAKSELINMGEYKPGKISLSMGELMFDKFRGCLACHQIEPGYGGLSGPEMYTAGKRLQEDYMMSFMRNPKAWDPKIFMPSGYVRDNDLAKFVHYFHALSEENFE